MVKFNEKNVLVNLGTLLFPAHVIRYHFIWCSSECTVVFAGLQRGMEGSGLIPWVGGPPDASLGLYLREAFQSQTNTENILYNKSR